MPFPEKASAKDGDCMLDWLTGTDAGKMCVTFFLSMLPVGELRIGLPYGIALGLEYPLALMAALLSESGSVASISFTYCEYTPLVT